MKRWIFALATLALLGTGFAVFKNDIALLLFRKAISQQVSSDLLAEYPDGMHVASCGSGTPLPDQTMAGACTAVIAGGRLFVFDMGDGAPETMMRMGLDISRVEALFLTHFHSDHIAGLGSLVMGQGSGKGKSAPMRLYGAQGVEQIADGFNSAFAFDHAYRVEHHPKLKASVSALSLEPHAFEAPAERSFPVVYQSNGVTIRAFAVPHGPVRPAIGYRIEYDGMAVVISGDTEASDNLVAAAKGADLLVHEALNPQMVAIIEQEARAHGQQALATVMHDIPSYHATPVEAAEAASSAGVKALAYTHMIPPLPLGLLEGPFLAGVNDAYSGPVIVMRDGMVLTISKQQSPGVRYFL